MFTRYLVISLIFGGKFLKCDAAKAKITHHPKFIDCSLAGAENTLAVYENGTIQRCENGQLEVKFCFAGVNEQGEFECVKHARVKQTMDEANPLKRLLAAAYYTPRSNQALIECQKIWKDYPHKLYDSAYKLKCLEDLDEGPIIPGPGKNQLCLAKNHKAVLIEQSNTVKFCENGKFVIKKCMIPDKQNVVKCVARRHFGDRADSEMAELCKKFSGNPSTHLPNYEQYVEACNADLAHQAVASTTTTTTTTTKKPTTTKSTTTTTTTTARTTTTRKTTTSTSATTPAPSTKTVKNVVHLIPATRVTEAAFHTVKVTREPYPAVFTPPTPVYQFPIGKSFPRPVIERIDLSPPEDIPPFIDCTLPGIVENQVLVLNNSFWFECINGKLELEKCVTRKEYSVYYCQSHKKMKEYLDDLYARVQHISLLDNYINKRETNVLYCPTATQHGLIQHYVEEDACGADAVFEDYDAVQGYGDELCILFPAGYSIVGTRFYECRGFDLYFSKCFIMRMRTNERRNCVAKDEVKYLLDWDEHLSEEYMCDVFNDKYELLKENNVINTIACNKYIWSPVIPPIREEKTTKITTTTTTIRPRVTTTSRSTPRKVIERSPVPKITEPPPYEVDDKFCLLSDTHMPGKCVHIDDFVRKFDNYTVETLMEKLDYTRILGNSGGYVLKVGDMTLGNFLGFVHEAEEMLLSAQMGEAALHLITMLKEDEGFNDCDALRDHVIVNQRELCDIIKDCDPKKPMPPPPLCQT